MANIAGKKIIVIGGNGTLGSAAVESAVAAGAKVTILSRQATARSGVAAVQGSITDAVVVRNVLAGADGIVISVDASRTPEQLNAVYVEGVRNVLDSTPGEAQIIFMSHIGITNIERMPDYNEAKLESERLIRASGKPYTIFRPSWIISGLHGIKLEQGDHYTGRRDDIGHSGLGAAIVAAFENPESTGKTFELYGGGEQSPIWAEAFKLLSPDKREIEK